MKKYPDTDCYTWGSVNPKNHMTGDCVIRAIATASGMTWDTVYRALCDLGYKLKRMPNDYITYERWLAEHGWAKHSQPRKPDNRKYTLREFLQDHHETLIVNVGSLRPHVTCALGGKCVDQWDCTGERVGNWWSKA